MDAEPADAGEASRCLQRQRELARRPHRTDGVGAGRADADGEELEDADCHATVRTYLQTVAVRLPAGMIAERLMSRCPVCKVSLSAPKPLPESYPTESDDAR